MPEHKIEDDHKHPREHGMIPMFRVAYFSRSHNRVCSTGWNPSLRYAIENADRLRGRILRGYFYPARPITSKQQEFEL